MILGYFGHSVQQTACFYSYSSLPTTNDVRWYGFIYYHDLSRLYHDYCCILWIIINLSMQTARTSSYLSMPHCLMNLANFANWDFLMSKPPFPCRKCWFSSGNYMELSRKWLYCFGKFMMILSKTFTNMLKYWSKTSFLKGERSPWQIDY